MPIAALYDIHGNLPALDAVLADVEHAGVDEIVVGGDVVPGPMPREVFERLARVDLPIRYISGNGDREILLRMRGGGSTVPPAYELMLQWVAAQLDSTHEHTMAAWPATLRIGDMLFCHASPRNDMDIFTRVTPDEALLPIIQPANARVIVCGHTHMQFDRMVGTTRVVNAGSVGMPFDASGAFWLLIDDDLELKRTEYDLEAAAATIRVSSYPGADDFARSYVLSQPGEAKMLEVYSKVPL